MELIQLGTQIRFFAQTPELSLYHGRQLLRQSPSLTHLTESSRFGHSLIIEKTVDGRKLMKI